MNHFWKSGSPLLLMAPPAWGKTRLMLHWFSEGFEGLWVYLSPLRALANEVMEKACSVSKCLNFTSKSTIQADHKVIVLTPELWTAFMAKNSHKNLRIIVDEIHLFYLWGDDFRPVLLECLRDICMKESSFVMLSASISAELCGQITFDLSQYFSHYLSVDLGNFQFKTPPQRHYCLSLNSLFEEMILSTVLYEQKVLLFLPYRDQVKRWVQYFGEKNIRAIGCVGGEVQGFCEKIRTSDYQVFISTTCLSHGVNLPSFSKVFILERSVSDEFWLQMASRSGRRGEDYQLYSLDERKSILLAASRFASLRKVLINRLMMWIFSLERPREL